MSDPLYLNAEGLKAPAGHYSHAVVVNGLVFVSGLLPVDAQGNMLASASFEVQTRQALDNLAVILKASGSAVSRLVQVRAYLSNIENWTEFNRIYQAWIGDVRPARAVVPVPGLHHGVAIEIEAVGAVTD